MKKSIFARTYSGIIITVLLILVIAYAVTSIFAQSLYYANKIANARIASLEVEALLNDEELSFSEFMYKMDDLAIETGGRIVVFDENNSVIYGGRSADWNSQGSEQIPNPNVFLPEDAVKLGKGESKVYEYSEHVGEASMYTFAERLSNGMLVLVAIRVESISEAVSVMKRMLMLVMLAACLIAFIAAYVISRNISRPLSNLNKIAREIGRLNFGIRYEGKRQDEIGDLGRTLNNLSDKLEKNIDGLQAELEKEKNLQSLRRQFTAQASHEMQTPIAIINSYLEAIEDGMVEDEAELEEYFKVIREENDKMSTMVRSMLDISQIESGTFTIKREEFDIYGLLEPACEKFKTLAENQSIVFSHDEIPQSCFMVYGDEQRLEQVLANFISNAYKHADGGKVELNFKEIKEDDMVQLPRGRYKAGIRISVFNEGSSIREEDMPYIWESFYKANTNTGRKGTGLGLAISRSILQMHYYAYGAQNINGGVEFWFEASGRPE